MIVCPGCQTRYDDDGTRFCGKCGTDLGKARKESKTSPEKAAQKGDRPVDRQIGRVVDGRYRVLEKLGQGGMGAVYKVEHLAMGKLAAMKVLHPTMTDDREVSQRFRREAEAVSRLSSPFTVQTFDFGEADGALYLVMELCKGEDLGAILRRDGPLPFSRLGPMLLQVCDALSEAHEAGVVHRDLKPENLLVTRARDGSDLIKVLDFGLAKLRDQEELSQVTARGSLVGTPFYMSPEQIRAEELDGRSDIYALGALMYRVLTGVHPFTAPTPVAVLTAHLTEELVPPTKRRPDAIITPKVEAMVVKAMAKHKEERFQSADELKATLREALASPSQRLPSPSGEMRRSSDADEPPGVTPTGAVERLQRSDFDAYERGLKVRRWLGLSILPLGLLLGVAAFVVFQRVAPQLAVRDYEREPNNTPALANHIASGKPIKGQVGKRIAMEQSDRDFYRFDVPAQLKTATLRVELSGLPNMELVLEVFDGAGEKIAEADNGGMGDGEIIPNLRITAGEHYIAVREVWVAGRPATENVSDFYTLTATWRAPAAGEETEPDDNVADAQPIAAGQTVRGMLSRANDVDYYLVGGTGGALVGEVTGVPGVDVRVVVLPAGATAGPPGPLPTGAKVFDGGAAGAGEKFEALPGSIVVVERKLPRARPKASTDTEDKPPVTEIATPYELSLRVKP